MLMIAYKDLFIFLSILFVHSKLGFGQNVKNRALIDTGKGI